MGPAVATAVLPEGCGQHLSNLSHAAHSSQNDYSKDHQVASHRWPGANTAIPFFYGYDEQMKVTDAYLKDTLALDIFAMSKVESGKERLIAPLDRQNFNLLAVRP